MCEILATTQGRVALAVFCLVCKKWDAVANAVLWRNLDDVHPLWQLVVPMGDPEIALEGENSNYFKLVSVMFSVARTATVKFGFRCRFADVSRPLLGPSIRT